MLKRALSAAFIAAAGTVGIAGEAMAQSWPDFGLFHRPRYQAYYSGPDYMPAGPMQDPYGGPVYYGRNANRSYNGYPAYQFDPNGYYHGDPNGPPGFDESYYNPTVDRQAYGTPLPARKPAKHKVAKAKPVVTPAPDSASATDLSGPPPVRPTTDTASAGATPPAPGATASVSSAKTSVPAIASTAPVAKTVASVDPKPSATNGIESVTGSTSPAKPASKTATSCDKAEKIVLGYGFSDVKSAACSGKIYAFNATRDGKSYSVKLDPASGELTEVKKVQ